MIRERKNIEPKIVQESQSKQRGFFAKVVKMRGLYSLYLVALLILLIIGRQNVIDPAYLLRDPPAILDAPFYVGIISNIGILMLCASTSICFFTFVITQKYVTQAISSFLLGSTAINGLLLIDDFFLLHDDFFPNYANVSEKVVVVIYLILGLWYLLKNRTAILRTNFLLLGVAILFLVISLAIDNTSPLFPASWREDGTKVLIEDGFKLLGIITFTYYYINFCFDCISQFLWREVEHENAID